jgi:hypothetical protein
MSWWREQAYNLQNSVREVENRGNPGYDDEEVRSATVHARQDIVLLYSLLDSANRQLRTIKLLLAVIAFLIIYACMRIT